MQRMAARDRRRLRRRPSGTGLALATLVIFAWVGLTDGRASADAARFAVAAPPAIAASSAGERARLAMNVAIKLRSDGENGNADRGDAVLEVTVINRQGLTDFNGGRVHLTLTNNQTTQREVSVPAVPARSDHLVSIALPKSKLDPAHAPLKWRVRLYEAEHAGTAADASTPQPVAERLVADATGTMIHGPRWMILGPFEHSGRTEGGFAEAFGPEAEHTAAKAEEGGSTQVMVRPDAAYPLDPASADSGTRRWRPLPETIIRQPDGYRDFRQLFGERNNVTIYAATHLVSDADRRVQLRIGSDDAVRMWVNGTLAHENNILRGSGPGQDVIDVDLKAGVNEVVLKIVQWGGWYGFHFDLADEQGQPLDPSAVHVPDGWMIDRPALPELTIVDVSAEGPLLTWRSDAPAPTAVMVQPATAERFDPAAGMNAADLMLRPVPGSRPVRMVGSPILRTEHRMQVRGLEPGTRYIAWAEETTGGGSSDQITFTTPARPGEMQYLRLRLVNLIFTNVTEEGSEGLAGADVPMPDAQVDRIIEEMNENVMFYWVNSGMKVWLDMTNLRYDEPLTIAPDTKYGYAYNDGNEYEILDHVLAARGEKGSDYDGVNFVSADKRFENGSWIWPASGGGTLGPLPPYNIGKSGWKGGCDHAWLFCHEFGHQLDALYAHSGGGGDAYLFNHFQPWDGTAHRHGEHWDGNAWLLREWAGHVDAGHQHMNRYRPGMKTWRYLTCRWGEIVTTADRDQDGIPDDDPRVPLDEVRFGSSPEQADTDGDGLSDLGEAMVRTWTTFGLNEYFADSRRRAPRMDPMNPDSDGDGLRDGIDPEPLYAIEPAVPLMADVTFDGRPTELPVLMTIDDEAFRGDVRLARTADHLVIGVTAARIEGATGSASPRLVHLMLDLDDDGWYVGRDNIIVRLNPGASTWLGGARKRAGADFASVELNNCGVPGRYPFFDPEALAENEIEAREWSVGAPSEGDVHAEGLAWSAEVRIPVNSEYGFENQVGERIGLLVGIEPRTGIGRPGRTQRLLTPFEPHSFVSLELRQSLTRALAATTAGNGG